MFELQETRNAHVSPQDDDFETVSKHRKLERAIKYLGKHKRIMRKTCGPYAWDHNHRIINGDTGTLANY